MMDFFGSLRLCVIWMDIPVLIWWEVHSSIMNLNIFWTENKELPHGLGAAQWTGLIVAVCFFFSSRSYNMYSDHEKIILTALSVTFLHFFHSAPYGGAHQCDITDYSVENPLLFHIIAEIMDSGLLSVQGYTVVISHLNDEWRYSRHI